MKFIYIFQLNYLPEKYHIDCTFFCWTRKFENLYFIYGKFGFGHQFVTFKQGLDKMLLKVALTFLFFLTFYGFFEAQGHFTYLDTNEVCWQIYWWTKEFWPFFISIGTIIKIMIIWCNIGSGNVGGFIKVPPPI